MGQTMDEQMRDLAIKMEQATGQMLLLASEVKHLAEEVSRNSDLLPRVIALETKTEAARQYGGINRWLITTIIALFAVLIAACSAIIPHLVLR